MEKVAHAFLVQSTPGSTPQQIKEATSWLEQFQATTEAWQVADQLLSQGPGEHTKSAPEHIFAAQTMRTKIQYDWAELPAEAHASLRSSLLSHVLRFGQGPQPVLTALCLAVGVLALHMEDWHATVVNDLINSLTTPPEQATAKLPCLLELLLVLPEEAENYKVNVLPKKRDNFRMTLAANAPAVITLLGQVCTQCQAQKDTPAGNVILNKMLRCVASWMRHVELSAELLGARQLAPRPSAVAVSIQGPWRAAGTRRVTGRSVMGARRAVGEGWAATPPRPFRARASVRARATLTLASVRATLTRASVRAVCFPDGACGHTAQQPLIPYGFSSLASPALFDAASDLIVETIHYTANAGR